MKRMFSLVALVLLLGGAAFAQSQVTFGLLAGYSMTAFAWEDFIGLEESDEAGNLLVGAELGYRTGSLELGAGFNYVLPYKVEITSEDPEEIDEKATLDINQSMALLFAKFHLGAGAIHPYVKGGAGYYFGDTDLKYEYDGETIEETAKVDPAIGFNFGGGLNINNLFIDFTYHIVERTMEDDEDEEAFGMNTWNVGLGIRF
ncbi:MAG TPA: outer membrane beta-barrel protein [bacterium]|nr:outer membrane beta-barrel protein [bacterium]HNT64405.1 outer membrane beta-barrel protein [bacterium]